jgi:hypothetical protein
MKFPPLLAALSAALLVPLAAVAQADASQCIVAGRLAADGRWAPQSAAVRLLDARGRPVASADRAALGQVRQAQLGQPALLSRCDGDNDLARADEEPVQAKTRVPALSAGLVEVEAVSYPRLRTGGTLVELKVRVPAERVVMLTR